MHENTPLSPEDSLESNMLVTAFLDTLLSKIKETREKIPPEKEYFLSAVITYLYLVMLVNPESFPATVKPLLELLRNMPSSQLVLWSSAILSFIGTVDGARRIVLHQLPFYKAYFQVFLLGKWDSS